jgi:N-acyl-D-amino-acid deacylase
MLAGLFILAGAGQGDGAEEVVPDLKTAIKRGLRRVEEGAANYTKHRQCFSCHHQAVSIEAMAAARKLGHDIEATKLDHQVKFTLESFSSRRELLQKGEGVGGASTTVAYGLLALKMGGHESDDTTAAMIDYLLKLQRPDGSWKPSANRPPTEGSVFTTTSQALRALQATESSMSEDQRERFQNVLEKGRAWLQNNEPEHTEDRVFQLLGLLAVDAAPDVVERARDALLKEQQDDGGWRQIPTLASDAYATGTVLSALHAAGVPASDPAYQRGVQFLLRTQKEDGSWFVETRSRPIQTFFDNGDPGGKSQFISFAATNWALVALLPALNPQPQ